MFGTVYKPLMSPGKQHACVLL